MTVPPAQQAQITISLKRTRWLVVFTTAYIALLAALLVLDWRVEPGDVSALVYLLERLAQDRESISIAGALSRAAFEEHYDRPIGAARVAMILGLQPTADGTEPTSELATVR